MYIRRVKFSLQSTSFTTLLGKNVGRLLFNRRAHTEPKTAMSHPHVFFCIVQCTKLKESMFFFVSSYGREQILNRTKVRQICEQILEKRQRLRHMGSLYDKKYGAFTVGSVKGRGMREGSLREKGNTMFEPKHEILGVFFALIN